MIEYLYNAVRATAGENVCICAKITDEDGVAINTNSHLMIYDDLAMIVKVDGTIEDNVWSYEIPGELTAGLSGRYWYCICADDTSLCFKQPIYFI